MTALTAPPTQSQLAAAGDPFFDALFIEHTIATQSTAPSARYGRPCATCGAAADQPCRTLTTGRVTDTHAARIRGDS